MIAHVFTYNAALALALAWLPRLRLHPVCQACVNSWLCLKNIHTGAKFNNFRECLCGVTGVSWFLPTDNGTDWVLITPSIWFLLTWWSWSIGVPQKPLRSSFDNIWIHDWGFFLVQKCYYSRCLSDKAATKEKEELTANLGPLRGGSNPSLGLSWCSLPLRTALIWN